MNDLPTITFVIGRKFPEDFPLERIARYLTAVAGLVGPNGKVRLSAIKRGSVKVQLQTTPEYYPELVSRLTCAPRNDAPTQIRKAYDALQTLVQDDRVDAKFKAPGGAQLLHLRGFKSGSSGMVGPIRNQHQIRGRLIGLEGKDETKHARILVHGSGEEVSGEIRDTQLYLRMRQWLFEPTTIEVAGPGSSVRNSDGLWELKSFRIDSAIELDDTKSSDVLAAIRATLRKDGLLPNLAKIGTERG